MPRGGGRGRGQGRFPARRKGPAGISKRRQDDDRPRRGGPKRGGRGGKRGGRKVGPKKEKATAGDLDMQLANYWGANKKAQFQEDLNEELDEYFKKGKAADSKKEDTKEDTKA